MTLNCGTIERGSPFCECCCSMQVSPDFLSLCCSANTLISEIRQISYCNSSLHSENIFCLQRGYLRLELPAFRGIFVDEQDVKC